MPTFLSDVNLPRDPSTALLSTTKQYVDNRARILPSNDTSGQGSTQEALLSNQLANYTARGGTVASSVTGTVNVSSPLLDSLTQTFPGGPSAATITGGASGGTAIFTLTATTLNPPVVTPANANWTGYVQMRHPGSTYLVTPVTIEAYDNTGAWQSMGTVTEYLGSGLYTASVGVTNYPPKGIRVTLTIPIGATYYIRQVGIFHLSTPMGEHTLLSRGGGNLYGALSLAADPTLALHAATKQYVDLKANIASPTFTGIPAAPTASLGTNTTQLATTAFVLANAAGSGLPLTGGTLTGGLTITAPSGDLALNVSRAGNASYIYVDAVDPGTERYAGLNLRRRGQTRWTIAKNSAAETGSDTGSDFTIYKYADDGSTALVAYAINRQTLQSIFYGGVEVQASTTALASLRLKPGVAPTTPLNGDMWVTTAGLYTQINGATVGPLGAGGGGLTADSVTNAYLANMPTLTIKGNNTGVTADPLDLTVAQTKTLLALDQVNNTTDLNKPISTAEQTALNLKANLASPTFTGTPLSTTAAVDTNTTQLATTAYVVAQGYAKLAGPTFTGIPAAPTAAALTNTTQLATTAFVTTADNLKANLASPTFTGTPAAPTAAALTNTTQLATTAFVTTANNLKLNLTGGTLTGPLLINSGAAVGGQVKSTATNNLSLTSTNDITLTAPIVLLSASSSVDLTSPQTNISGNLNVGGIGTTLQAGSFGNALTTLSIHTTGSSSITNYNNLLGIHGLADPTDDYDAANKGYVDSMAGGGLDQSTADGLYVNVTGDTMTGNLNMASSKNINAYNGTSGVYTNYLEVYLGVASFLNGAHMGGYKIEGVAAPTIWSNAANKQYVDSYGDGSTFAIPVGSYLGSPYLQGGTALTGAYGASMALTVTRALCYPILVRNSATFNAWWSNIQTAATDSGATQVAALYTADATTGLPKTLVQDLGSRVATATGALDTSFTALALQPGNYWLCHRVKAATTAGTNPAFTGNAMASVSPTLMATGNTNIILAIDATAMGASWVADITSYLVYNLTTLTTIPRVGLKRSA